MEGIIGIFLFCAAWFILIPYTYKVYKKICKDEGKEKL